MKAFELRSEKDREIHPLLLVGGIEHSRGINGLVVYAEALFWNWPAPPARIRAGWTLNRFRGEATEQERDFIAIEGAKIWAEEQLPDDRSNAVALNASWHSVHEPETAIKRRVFRSSLMGACDSDTRFVVSEFMDRIMPDTNVSLWEVIAPFGRASRNPQ